MDLSGIIASVAVLWTMLQQMQINQICKKCPYFPANSGLNKSGLWFWKK